MDGLLDAVGWPVGEILTGVAWLVGDMGLAIILVVIIARAALLPLARRHYRMQAATARLFPQLQALHAELKDQPEELERQMRDMYRAEHATPYGWMVFPVVQITLLVLLFLGVGVALVGQPGLWGWIPDLSTLAVNSTPGWILVAVALVIVEVRLAMGWPEATTRRDRGLLLLMMIGWCLGSIAMTAFLPVGIELAILTAVIWSAIEARILKRYRAEAARGSEGVIL